MDSIVGAAGITSGTDCEELARALKSKRAKLQAGSRGQNVAAAEALVWQAGLCKKNTKEGKAYAQAAADVLAELLPVCAFGEKDPAWPDLMRKAAQAKSLPVLEALVEAGGRPFYPGPSSNLEACAQVPLCLAMRSGWKPGALWLAGQMTLEECAGLEKAFGGGLVGMFGVYLLESFNACRDEFIGIWKSKGWRPSLEAVSVIMGSALGFAAIEAGFDARASGPSGRNILHSLFAGHVREDIQLRLFEKLSGMGADVNAQDEAGVSAWDILKVREDRPGLVAAVKPWALAKKESEDLLRAVDGESMSLEQFAMLVKQRGLRLVDAAGREVDPAQALGAKSQQAPKKRI